MNISRNPFYKIYSSIYLFSVFKIFSNISDYPFWNSSNFFPRILEKHKMFNYFYSRIFKFLNQSNQEPGTWILEKHKMFNYFNSRTFKFLYQSNQEPGTRSLDFRKHQMFNYFNSRTFKFLNQSNQEPGTWILEKTPNV